MAIPSELEGILVADPDIISGAVRFVGTHVPGQALIDTLDGGDFDEFIEGWPNVPREFAEAVVHWEQSQARLMFGSKPSAAMRPNRRQELRGRRSRRVAGRR